MIRAKTLQVIVPLALTVTFGFQLFRQWLTGLFYYLYEVTGATPGALIALTGVIFAVPFFAGVIQRRLGTRALVIVGGAIAGLRVIEQLNGEPALDFVVTSIGLAAFLLFLPIMFNTLRASDQDRHFAPALLVGLSLDTALKGAFGTVDLSWIPGVVPLVIVIGLAALQVWLLLRFDRSAVAATQVATWPLIAIGPFFFLQAQFFQNIGHITTVTGFSQPLAFELIILGNGLGLLMASFVYERLPRRAWTWMAAVGLLLIVTVLPLSGDALAPLEVLAGQVAASIGLAVITQGRGARSTALVFGVGGVLMLLLIIGYYIGHIFILPIPAWLFHPIAAIVILIAAAYAVLKSDGTTTPDRLDWTAGMSALALMIVPVIALLSWQDPIATTGQLPVRVMSYNLHSAFDVTGRLSLEGLAQTIEAEKADVIALQEVSRGWLIDGSVDMLTWLSQRLHMPFVWGPTADPLWGNAILSRYPIDDVQQYAMPNNDQIRPMRGYLVATVNAGDLPLTIIDTHLHHVGNGSDLRVTQVQALIDTWAKRPATVLLGDLNAWPDSPEMQLARTAGLIDSFAEAGTGDGFTWRSDAADRRIDYIYHSPDLIARDFAVNASPASDHRAVVVTLDRSR